MDIFVYEIEFINNLFIADLKTEGGSSFHVITVNCFFSIRGLFAI